MPTSENEEGYSSDELFTNTNHSSNLENDLPTIFITSFGHRRGPLVPTPDISVDLRTLPNPPKNVRTGQTGLSKVLREWLFSDDQVQRRFDGICTLIQDRIRTAQANGVHEITVGVCCELGKHRSVAVVEQLGETRFKGWNVMVNHRDVHLKRSNHGRIKLDAGRHAKHDDSG
ncbi:hypothetical protein GALMADRAFT_140814 [Galerina marginata CBS 339.88]|uniref:RapZ C-terminal domain-containing protein n=1 Tax=Galerina marginata (strain CBS 339.88) TaxID=685588 RepID=A0A067T5T0_GALM3|nr:hypothetical protein GALMADRAFT_140814 [Galerina marginata CBS 339.88]